ncbi:MAG: hypothetical protein LBT10_00590 [Methanobrevibacter sp.]|nr:hypothetical protein [Methanobrevibacter sp.]
MNRRFEKLTTHTREENIDKTSNKCETFNSLPQIRHLKKNSKGSGSLLRRIASIVKNYESNIRTLRNRHKYENYPC